MFLLASFFVLTKGCCFTEWHTKTTDSHSYSFIRVSDRCLMAIVCLWTVGGNSVNMSHHDNETPKNHNCNISIFHSHSGSQTLDGTGGPVECFPPVFTCVCIACVRVNVCAWKHVCVCICEYASQIQLFIISSANMVWLFYVSSFFFFLPVLFIIYYAETHNVWVE